MFVDFLPGTCIFDVFPSLLQLPKWMQPWYWILSSLKNKEAKIQKKYIEQAKREAATFQNLECFANKLRGVWEHHTYQGTQAERLQ